MQSPAYPALGVAAKGVVQRSDGSILLIRRSPGSKFDPGRWELPGGKMDPGERLVDALVREVREETGLKVGGPRPIHVSHFSKEPFWVTCVTFVCASFEGDVQLSREHDAYAWVLPADRGGRLLARTMEEQIEAFVALAGDKAPG
ncbi:MAG: NUDIX domain-containing protein [Candidatus Limnocylindrales bacterium]